jgi:hypothetical protein
VNDRKITSILARISCIFAPLIVFLLIRLVNVLERWKYDVAGGIVLAWSIAICCLIWTTRRNEICQPCRRGFFTSLVEHGLVLCLAALMLDGGMTLYACILASMFYWMTAGVVVARRPAAPTPIDVSLVAHGYLLLAFAVSSIYLTTVSIRGY